MLLILLIFLSANTTFAQLSPFQLNVSAVNETCSGNGSATLSTSGTVNGASIIYSLFKLPDTVNPVSVISSGNFIGGLTSDTYLVVATQSSGAQSNTQQKEFTIADQTSALTFTAETTPANCGNNGTITIATTNGSAVSMEIINGPVITGIQNSLTVNSLPAGVYTVRVYDSCNQGYVQTITIPPTATLSLNPQPTVSQQLINCNAVTVSNQFSYPGNIPLTYPFNVLYTIYPPDGSAPVIINTPISAGNPTQLQLSTVIPYYSGQIYSYDMVITDGCSNATTFSNIPFNGNFGAAITQSAAPCGDYFIKFNVNNFLPPITIDFIQFPASFSPLNYNASDPASFPGLPIFYGSATVPVPFGLYKAVVSDACGRSITVSRNILYITPTPTVQITPLPGCESYKSDVKIMVNGYSLNTASIQSGPAGFSSNYPVNLNNLITNGVFKITNLVTGTYHIDVMDTCGNSYPIDFTVPPLATTVSTKVWPGCDVGKASVQFSGDATQLVSVILNSVVPSNGMSFPMILSGNISMTNPGIFTINDLSTGVYNFTILDNCGITHTEIVNVTGYKLDMNSYQIAANCGTFDLTLNHLSNSESPLLWLQKLDPITGNWVHPGTNVAMIAGDLPTNLNGFPLINASTTYNIGFSGHFRIIKRSQIFDNGIGSTLNCIETLQEFDYSNALAIIKMEKLACGGATSDVVITAEGPPPLTYKISTKDGLPFNVNNGNNNIFLNLAPGVYNFQVLDICGNIANQLADVASLPTRVEITPIEKFSDFVECDQADNDSKALFNLADLEPEILANSLPGNYSITFYTSLLNASSGINAIPNEIYTSETRIFIRIAYSGSLNCYDISYVDILVNPYPLANIETVKTKCFGETATLTAPSGFESYLWSTGESSESIVVSATGNYSVEITQTSNGKTCTGTYTIAVVDVEIPVFDEIITTDWTDNENSLTVILAENPQNFIYSLDNINFQSENVFSKLSDGEYTVYVKNKLGCKSFEKSVFLLGYPKYFTPNGDSFNDLWFIPYASQEPDMKIYIFDRLGKFLKVLGSQSKGWDGTYNNKLLPATDYWFYVTRQNGEKKSGHFSLKR